MDNQINAVCQPKVWVQQGDVSSKLYLDFKESGALVCSFETADGTEVFVKDQEPLIPNRPYAVQAPSLTISGALGVTTDLEFAPLPDWQRMYYTLVKTADEAEQFRMIELKRDAKKINLFVTHFHKGRAYARCVSTFVPMFAGPK